MKASVAIISSHREGRHIRDSIDTLLSHGQEWQEHALVFPIICSNLVINTDRVLALALGCVLKLSRFCYIGLSLNDVGFCIGLEPFVIGLVWQEELAIAFQIVEEAALASRFRERVVVGQMVILGLEIFKTRLTECNDGV